VRPQAILFARWSSEPGEEEGITVSLKRGAEEGRFFNKGGQT